MYLKYGSFQFNPGEATISSVDISSNFSARGFRISRTMRIDCEGEVCSSTGDPKDVTTRLNEIENALSVDGHDFGLYHDDNTPSTHWLASVSSQNITGNQVLYVKYPGAYGGEFVDGRMFAFGIGAELIDAETPLLQYHDSIQQHGNGAADIRWRWHPRFRRWVTDRLAPFTKVTYVHSGFAETIGAWFDVPPPYYTSPLFLKSEAVAFGREHPKRRPQGYMGRITTWRYVYELPAPNPLILPILRLV